MLHPNWTHRDKHDARTHGAQARRYAALRILVLGTPLLRLKTLFAIEQRGTACPTVHKGNSKRTSKHRTVVLGDARAAQHLGSNVHWHLGGRSG